MVKFSTLMCHVGIVLALCKIVNFTQYVLQAYKMKAQYVNMLLGGVEEAGANFLQNYVSPG